MSTGAAARKMPERPPVTKRETKPMAKSMAVEKWRRPCQRVVHQLKVLMAEGRAMTMVEPMKAAPRRGCMPLTNMWWPQTRKLRKPMAESERTMAL
jgi:hypothetical protein